MLSFECLYRITAGSTVLYFTIVQFLFMTVLVVSGELTGLA